jgi:hypothetical protein
MPTVFTTEVQQLAPLKTSIENNAYIVIMIFHILKKSFAAKGCKFSLYELKIGVSNCNRVPSNRSILQFRSNQSKRQYQLTVYGRKGKCKCRKLTLIIYLHVKKENQHDDKNEVYSQYVHPDL